MPVPQFPNPVPSPIVGAAVKAARLKYPLMRAVSDPELAIGAPVHSARTLLTEFPYAVPALESTTVIGKPDCSTMIPENCQPERDCRATHGPLRSSGARWTKLSTKRCVRSKSEGPYAFLGSVWSLVTKVRSNCEELPLPPLVTSRLLE